MNADGSGVRRLTRSPKYDGFPQLSPDGQKIVFYSQRGGTGSGWIMTAGGNGQRRLAEGGCPCSWSPDGGKIAFSSGRDGNSEIYVMNADGSGQKNLSPSPSTHEWEPSWSPDGRT